MANGSHRSETLVVWWTRVTMTTQKRGDGSNKSDKKECNCVGKSLLLYIYPCWYYFQKQNMFVVDDSGLRKVEFHREDLARFPALLSFVAFPQGSAHQCSHSCSSSTQQIGYLISLFLSDHPTLDHHLRDSNVPGGPSCCIEKGCLNIKHLNSPIITTIPTQRCPRKKCGSMTGTEFGDAAKDSL